MPKRTASPNMEFAVAQLRRNPKMTFGALKTAAAKRKGLSIVPIIYGRAKLALGLTGANHTHATVEVDGHGPAAVPRRRRNGVATPEMLPDASAGMQVVPPRRRGRPRRQPTDAASATGTSAGSNGSLNLNQLVEAVRLAEAQHRALEQIQAILDQLGIHSSLGSFASQPPKRRRGRPRKTA